MPNNNNVLKFTNCPISEGMFPVNSLSRSNTEASDMNVGSDGVSNAEKKDEQWEGARDKKILQMEFCNSLNAVNRPILDGKVLVNSFWWRLIMSVIGKKGMWDFQNVDRVKRQWIGEATHLIVSSDQARSEGHPQVCHHRELILLYLYLLVNKTYTSTYAADNLPNLLKHPISEESMPVMSFWFRCKVSAAD